MVEGQAREKGIAIETDLPPEIGEIPLDADRMTQVFLNLFLNAIAAMEAGGILRVSLARQDERTVRISVADTGIGIPKEDLPRVFDPYFTTKSSGTGLGLAIVQKIVEAHGGEILSGERAGTGHDGDDPPARSKTSQSMKRMDHIHEDKKFDSRGG